MTKGSFRLVSTVAAVAVAGAVSAVTAAGQSSPQRPAAGANGGRPAVEAIRSAVLARVGGDARVTVTSIDAAAADLNVLEAKPDPLARLGKPMRFSLVTSAGVIPVTAALEVEVTHAVAREGIDRGHAASSAVIDEVRGVLAGTPITRVMTKAEAAGARALRPIAAGAVLLPGDLAVPRVVEPGDKVTVRALSGAIEVTAAFLAVDGGSVGDTIRVRNPETRKYIRGRIVKAGVVEVIYER